VLCRNAVCLAAAGGNYFKLLLAKGIFESIHPTEGQQDKSTSSYKIV